MTKYATLNCEADGWKVMIPISTVWCEGCHVQAISHVNKTFCVCGARVTTVSTFYCLKLFLI